MLGYLTTVVNLRDEQVSAFRSRTQAISLRHEEETWMTSSIPVQAGRDALIRCFRAYLDHPSRPDVKSGASRNQKAFGIAAADPRQRTVVVPKGAECTFGA